MEASISSFPKLLCIHSFIRSEIPPFSVLHYIRFAKQMGKFFYGVPSDGSVGIKLSIQVQTRSNGVCLFYVRRSDCLLIAYAYVVYSSKLNSQHFKCTSRSFLKLPSTPIFVSRQKALHDKSLMSNTHTLEYNFALSCAINFLKLVEMLSLIWHVRRYTILSAQLSLANLALQSPGEELR